MIDPLIELRAEVAMRREDLRIARKHAAESAARTATPANVAAWRADERWVDNRSEAHREAQARLIAAVSVAECDGTHSHAPGSCPACDEAFADLCSSDESYWSGGEAAVS